MSLFIHPIHDKNICTYLSCGICGAWSFDILWLGCHLICKKCLSLSGFTDDGNACVCPQCKNVEKNGPSLFPSLVFGEMDICCPLLTRINSNTESIPDATCKWTGKLKEANKHLETYHNKNVYCHDAPASASASAPRLVGDLDKEEKENEKEKEKEKEEENTHLPFNVTEDANKGTSNVNNQTYLCALAWVGCRFTTTDKHELGLHYEDPLTLRCHFYYLASHSLNVKVTPVASTLGGASLAVIEPTEQANKATNQELIALVDRHIALRQIEEPIITYIANDDVGPLLNWIKETKTLVVSPYILICEALLCAQQGFDFWAEFDNANLLIGLRGVDNMDLDDRFCNLLHKRRDKEYVYNFEMALCRTISELFRLWGSSRWIDIRSKAFRLIHLETFYVTIPVTYNNNIVLAAFLYLPNEAVAVWGASHIYTSVNNTGPVHTIALFYKIYRKILDCATEKSDFIVDEKLKKAFLRTNKNSKCITNIQQRLDSITVALGEPNWVMTEAQGFLRPIVPTEGNCTFGLWWKDRKRISTIFKLYGKAFMDAREELRTTSRLIEELAKLLQKPHNLPIHDLSINVPMTQCTYFYAAYSWVNYFECVDNENLPECLDTLRTVMRHVKAYTYLAQTQNQWYFAGATMWRLVIGRILLLLESGSNSTWESAALKYLYPDLDAPTHFAEAPAHFVEAPAHFVEDMDVSQVPKPHTISYFKKLKHFHKKEKGSNRKIKKSTTKGNNEVKKEVQRVRLIFKFLDFVLLLVDQFEEMGDQIELEWHELMKKTVVCLPCAFIFLMNRCAYPFLVMKKGKMHCDYVTQLIQLHRSSRVLSLDAHTRHIWRMLDVVSFQKLDVSNKMNAIQRIFCASLK